MSNLAEDFKTKSTIIEIVIIVITLTIMMSGVFFAQKIIRENEVKSLIMQIEEYDAAINSFTEKYHALPGDVQNTVLYGITSSDTDGDGDNVITDRNKELKQANGEISNFWLHLSKSGALNKNYDGAENERAKTGNTFPVSKIGKQVGIIAFGSEGKIFYQIRFRDSDQDRLYTSNRSLKASEAFLFDKKIDDGNPQKGVVVAAGSDILNFLQNDECVKLGEYNDDNSIPSCQLRIEVR